MDNTNVRDFVESFDVLKKTQSPKMIVWDGVEEYFRVIGSEDIDESDMGTHISRFLEGYRDGSVIKKRISGSKLIDKLDEVTVWSKKIVLFVIFLVLISILVLVMAKEEPLTVGTRDHADEARSSSTAHQETRNYAEQMSRRTD